MSAITEREGRSGPGEPRPGPGRARALSAVLWRRGWLRATLTLTPPLAWFLVIYVASLVLMLITAFWTVNPLTNALEHTWTTANFSQLFTSTYESIIARTVGMAAAVTVTDALVALPFAYYMVRIASPRTRRALFTAILLPLWASYLARVYAWIVILQKGGTLSWTLQKRFDGRERAVGAAADHTEGQLARHLTCSDVRVAFGVGEQQRGTARLERMVDLRWHVAVVQRRCHDSRFQTGEIVDHERVAIGHERCDAIAGPESERQQVGRVATAREFHLAPVTACLSRD